MRLLLLWEKGLAPLPIELRGVFADASVGLLTIGVVAGLLSLGRMWARAISLVVMLALVLISFAMYEFVSVFDSLYAMSHLAFVGDSTFLGGSVFHMRHPALFAAMVIAAVMGTLLAVAPTGKRWWGRWSALLGLSVLAQAVLPLSHAYDEWRQRHAIYANLMAARFVPGTKAGGSVGADVREVFQPNLAGKRWLGPFEGKPNVLLVMVEGASGAHLPSVAAAEGVESSTSMPRLDTIAQNHILFTRVISHQRQTNRGEYGILCGDYPKLITDQSKMSEQVYGDARRCLPELFTDAGYATAYIQSAPLGFMLKDQFMQKIGFEELIGDAWFERSYARTDWGVDDKAFFEQALGRVIELHQAEQPFFATLLTVGTHHPYTFPEIDASSGMIGRQAAAFRWADDAVAEFLGELERRGVLRDTVVIVTSDESLGSAQASSTTQRLLMQSWSFVIVMLPEPARKTVGTMHGHVDIALSIADLLGLERRARHFIGRSMFRDYEAPRRLFAGNTYARRVIMWESSGDAVTCPESFMGCMRSIPESGRVFGPVLRTEDVSARTQRLVGEVARLTQSGRGDMTEASAMELLAKDEASVPAEAGKKLIMGGQYLRVPAGTVVRVDLDMEILGAEDSTIELHQDVFLNGYLQFERTGVQLKAGERWRLSYELGVRRDSSHLVVQLYARTAAGESTSIRLHDARMSMTPAVAESREPVVIRDSVSRGDPHRD